MPPIFQITDFRDELFEYFIDVRTGLKGRLPKNIFMAKAREMYENWKKHIWENRILKIKNRRYS